jgi:hypothetical protein
MRVVQPLAEMVSCAMLLYRSLFERQSRRPFCEPELWHWPELPPRMLEDLVDEAAGEADETTVPDNKCVVVMQRFVLVPGFASF